MKNRTYQNWATAWLLMNENPEDLEEYLDLKEKMKDYTRSSSSSKTEEKVEAEAQWRRCRSSSSAAKS